MLESADLEHLHFQIDPRIYMSLASEKLETIRQQVQYHLDKAEENQLTPSQERDLCDAIRARLRSENAVLIAHYYTPPIIQVVLQLLADSFQFF